MNCMIYLSLPAINAAFGPLSKTALFWHPWRGGRTSETCSRYGTWYEVAACVATFIWRQLLSQDLRAEEIAPPAL